MSDLEDRYFATTIIDEINDSVSSLPQPVVIRVSGEFFGTMHPRILGKGLNSLDDTLTVSLATHCLDFFCGRSLNQKPISGHAVSGLG